APAGVVYGRVGLCPQEVGAVAAWLGMGLNALTGDLDPAGGAMFTTPAGAVVGLGAPPGQRGSLWGPRGRGGGRPRGWRGGRRWAAGRVPGRGDRGRECPGAADAGGQPGRFGAERRAPLAGARAARRDGVGRSVQERDDAPRARVAPDELRPGARPLRPAAQRA